MCGIQSWINRWMDVFRLIGGELLLGREEIEFSGTSFSTYSDLFSSFTNLHTTNLI